MKLYTQCENVRELFVLQVQEVIASALKCLKSPNTDPFYRRQSFEVIKCFLVNTPSNYRLRCVLWLETLLL